MQVITLTDLRHRRQTLSISPATLSITGATEITLKAPHNESGKSVLVTLSRQELESALRLFTEADRLINTLKGSSSDNSGSLV